MSAEKKFMEYKGLSLSETADEVLKKWDKEDTFHKSITMRGVWFNDRCKGKGYCPFRGQRVCYERRRYRSFQI